MDFQNGNVLMSIDFRLWDIIVDGSCGSPLCENELCANKSRIGLVNECA